VVTEIQLIDDAPEVSIIVPTYNAERWVGQTLQSLVTQMFTNIEIIVVNDGSTDNSENIVRQFFFDKRLRYIKKENGGCGSALNVGHEAARGKYVTWCSSDNIYYSNFILELYKALKSFEQQKIPCHFVYSDFTYINGNNQRLQDVVHKHPQSRHDLVNGYDLGISFMYTLDLWKKAGPYWNRICEDYEWAVRAAQYTEFGLVRLILAAFRVHPGQITGSKADEEKATADAAKALARQLIEQGKYAPLT
jgi:glycosyltransferase involved in cell wall biosynthesis